MNGDVLYFGCWNGSGHYLFRPEGEQISAYSNLPDGLRQFIDCGFLPPEQNGDQPEGIVHISHIGDWLTVLSFWDRSVDTRRNSHSTFVIIGFSSYDGAIKKARAAFPEVFQRFKFPIQPSFHAVQQDLNKLEEPDIQEALDYVTELGGFADNHGIHYVPGSKPGAEKVFSFLRSLRPPLGRHVARK